MAFPYSILFRSLFIFFDKHPHDFVFPGHYGDVSITGINKNGDYEGVIIEEFPDEDDSVSRLHMKGYLDWNEDYDRWNFYPYYPKPE